MTAPPMGTPERDEWAYQLVMSVCAAGLKREPMPVMDESLALTDRQTLCLQNLYRKSEWKTKRWEDREPRSQNVRRKPRQGNTGK